VFSEITNIELYKTYTTFKFKTLLNFTSFNDFSVIFREYVKYLFNAAILGM